MTNAALEPEQIDRAREALARRSGEQVELPSLDDVYARAGQRRRRRVVAGAAAAVAVLALGALAASQFGATVASSAPSDEVAIDAPSAPVEPSSPAVEGEPVMRFADGTRVWALSPEVVSEESGCCHLEEAGDERVVVRLDDGGARFEVTPDRTRDFVVRAGGVTVEVIGTGFEVERRSGEVEVNVLHGIVRVTSAEGTPVRLERGERATFSDEEVAAVAPTPEEVTLEDAVAKRAPKRTKKTAPRDGWRSRAKAGDYDAAAALLAERPDLNDVGDLFLAADSMRLTRNHDEALGYLDRILEKHSRDGRAPLAAITKGRILERRKGDPCGAAEAFGRATALGALGARGSLARDALIREAESWRACGKEAKAREALERFIARHPEHRERAERLLEGAP